MSAFPDSLLWLAPASYLLASLLTLVAAKQYWPLARASTLIALIGTLVACSWAGWQLVAGTGHADITGSTMLLLITLLGWVIVSYSQRYLDGEPGQRRYVSALLFTLSAVATVVLTGHLAILMLAWTASSLGLHQLLTYYPDRAPAQIVAHKKFLASRMAELCLLVALVLIFSETQTLSIEAIATHLATLSGIPPSLQAAAVLIALAVILKSAQLPLHGWLIQVMEAPTPVSALLHAGVVNIGGFVLIRLAELMSAVPIAQTLLVTIGGLTALLAGLVMMTRISIKVRLAWSTCAQMGFMLMECGLGLYELAFLHLIAHSLYKVHAFLYAGDVVNETRRQDLVTKSSEQSANHVFAWRIAALPLSLIVVMAAVLVWQSMAPDADIHIIAMLIVALGLAPLLWQQPARGILQIFALTQIYIVWHLGFVYLVPVTAEPSLWLAAIAGFCVVSLYVLQVWLLAYPRGKIAAALYSWAYAGFYLDERFTRLTFRIWPARLNAGLPTASVGTDPFLSGEKV